MPPLYKDGGDMVAKYTAKYNPTVVGTRFGDVKDVAIGRANTGLNAVDTIRSLVRPVLDEQGITGGTRATYLAFALKLWAHTQRQEQAAKEKIKEGLISYFEKAWGLSATILQAVADQIS